MSIARQTSQSINECTYLNHHLPPFISCSNDQIFTCSQVIKGQSLLQAYIRLTPLDLPPLLCFYHIWPSVALSHTFCQKELLLTRKEAPADERQKPSCQRNHAWRNFPRKCIFSPHVILFENLKFISSSEMDKSTSFPKWQVTSGQTES